MATVYKDIIELTIDLKTGVEEVILPVKQCDNLSHILRCRLKNYDKLINLAGSQLILYVVKADKTLVMINGIINDKKVGIVDFELTEQVLALVGEIQCEIVKIDSGNVKLSFPIFKVNIEDSIYDENLVQSQHEFSALTALISNVTGWENKFTGMYNDLDKKVDSEFEKTNAKLTELENKDVSIEVIERVTKEEIARQIADGTIANLAIEDESLSNAKIMNKTLTPKKTTFIQPTLKNLLNISSKSLSYVNGDSSNITRIKLHENGFEVLANKQIGLMFEFSDLTIGEKYCVIGYHNGAINTRVYAGDKNTMISNSGNDLVLMDFTATTTTAYIRVWVGESVPTTFSYLGVFKGSFNNIPHKNGVVDEEWKLNDGLIPSKYPTIDKVNEIVNDKIGNINPNPNPNPSPNIGEKPANIINQEILYSDRFDFEVGKYPRSGNIQYQPFNTRSIDVSDKFPHLSMYGKMLGCDIVTSTTDLKGFNLYKKVTLTRNHVGKYLKFACITNKSSVSGFSRFGLTKDDGSYPAPVFTPFMNNYFVCYQYLEITETMVNNNESISNISFMLGVTSQQTTNTLELFMPLIWIDETTKDNNYTSMVNQAYPKNYDKRFCDKVLLTYGDSITQQGGWQDIVKNKLNLYDYFNSGIGGSTVADNGATDTSGKKISFCTDDRINNTFNHIDAIFVMGGTNDCGQDIPLGNLEYPFNETTFKGGLASTIIKLQKRFPKTPIYIASPVGGRGEAGDVGQNRTEPVVNGIGLTTEDYANACGEVAKKFGLTFIDVFANSGINEFNRKDYIVDMVHLTTLGKESVGDCIARGLLTVSSFISKQENKTTSDTIVEVPRWRFINEVNYTKDDNIKTITINANVFRQLIEVDEIMVAFEDVTTTHTGNSYASLKVNSSTGKSYTYSNNFLVPTVNKKRAVHISFKGIVVGTAYTYINANSSSLDSSGIFISNLDDVLNERITGITITLNGATFNTAKIRVYGK